MKRPFIVAIVLNWNGMAIRYNDKSILEITLKTLSKVDYRNLKVILVDADSEDSSIEFVRSHFKKIDILKVQNKGWAYANNRAIKYAFKKYNNLDYILLLNDDLIFNEGNWLDRIVGAGDKSVGAGIIGCKLRYPNGGICEAGSYTAKFNTLVNVHKKIKKSGYVESVVGAVFLIKRKVLEEIGLFDEVYLPFFSEEMDFCKRALNYGYKTYYVNDTNITHLERYSIIKSDMKRKWKKEEIMYLTIRNDWIFLLRWYKYLLLPNLVYDTVQAFIGVDPQFYIRPAMEISLRLKFTITGLAEAAKLYKKPKITHL